MRPSPADLELSTIPYLPARSSKDRPAEPQVAPRKQPELPETPFIFALETLDGTDSSRPLAVTSAPVSLHSPT